MDLKWSTKLDVVQKCPIAFRCHPSNLTVTRTEKSSIWIQFEITRPIAAIKSLRFALLQKKSFLPCKLCHMGCFYIPKLKVWLLWYEKKRWIHSSHFCGDGGASGGHLWRPTSVIPHVRPCPHIGINLRRSGCHDFTAGQMRKLFGIFEMNIVICYNA